MKIRYLPASVGISTLKAAGFHPLHSGLFLQLGIRSARTWPASSLFFLLRGVKRKRNNCFFARVYMCQPIQHSSWIKLYDSMPMLGPTSDRAPLTTSSLGNLLTTSNRSFHVGRISFTKNDGSYYVLETKSMENKQNGSSPRLLWFLELQGSAEEGEGRISSAFFSSFQGFGLGWMWMQVTGPAVGHSGAGRIHLSFRNHSATEGEGQEGRRPTKQTRRNKQAQRWGGSLRHTRILMT